MEHVEDPGDATAEPGPAGAGAAADRAARSRGDWLDSGWLMIVYVALGLLAATAAERPWPIRAVGAVLAAVFIARLAGRAATRVRARRREDEYHTEDEDGPGTW